MKGIIGVVILFISIVSLCFAGELKGWRMGDKEEIEIYYKFIKNLKQNNKNKKGVDYSVTLHSLKCFRYRIESSSDLSKRYVASKATDDNFKTAWVEGKKDSGIGEWIKITIQRKKEYPNMHLRLDGLQLFGGIADKKYFLLNNRIKSLLCTMSYKGKTKKFRLFLDDVAKVHSESIHFMVFSDFKVIETSGPFVLKLEIEDVYKGSKYNDTGITELNIWGSEYDPAQKW